MSENCKPRNRLQRPLDRFIKYRLTYRLGVRQWINVTEGARQWADIPLLQLSTSHQELPTRTHPDHCSDGSQQPGRHKAWLLQRPSDRLHQTDAWQAATSTELFCESNIWWLQSPTRNSATPRSSSLATGKETHVVQTMQAHLCARQYTALHHVIWTRCALQCPLCPTFPLSVPPLMVIWSYLEQGYNSAAGHSVWLVRSPGTVYYLTFVRHLHYQRSKWYSRHICFLDPTSVTNCFQSTSSEHCAAPL